MEWEIIYTSSLTSQLSGPLLRTYTAKRARFSGVAPLFDCNLSEYPVEAKRDSHRLIKGDANFEREGFDKIIVDNPPVDRLCYQLRRVSRKPTHPEIWMSSLYGR